MYTVIVANRKFAYNDLDKAIRQLQFAIEVCHECSTLNRLDYANMLPRIGGLRDYLLPWEYTTEDGVLVRVEHRA